ncbi:MAG: MotA/TolQ/ExbB proton channel family protein [Pseudomonadales bacterium]
MSNFNAKLKTVVLALLAVFSLASLNVQAIEQAPTLEQLLQQVKQGSAQERREQKAREAQFLADKQQQAKRLAAAKRERAKLEQRSKALEKTYDANAKAISENKEVLTERLGVLKDLFGTVQAVAGDTRANLQTSLTRVQYPGRSEFLDQLIQKMSSTTQLASLDELRQLWFILQQEMTESGRVMKFPAQVILPNGVRNEQQVVRVGSFNIISDGQYLKYDAATDDLLVLPRQPEGRYTSSAGDLQLIASGHTAFGIDPTGPSGGSFLAALIDSPSWLERVHQGRAIGYLIIFIGVLALTIAIWRLLVLMSVSRKVELQLQQPDQPKRDNPLGRVLALYRENVALPIDALELKLHEAILRELPALEKWVNIIKLAAMVAPLLGLLGTVTGMILTFQALTIFGAGDPKAMAGGISSALVTTALGLCVAIPAIFLHALVSSRSKGIVQVLEEQTAGVIAEQVDK